MANTVTLYSFGETKTAICVFDQGTPTTDPLEIVPVAAGTPSTASDVIELLAVHAYLVLGTTDAVGAGWLFSLGDRSDTEQVAFQFALGMPASGAPGWVDKTFVYPKRMDGLIVNVATAGTTPADVRMTIEYRHVFEGAPIPGS